MRTLQECKDEVASKMNMTWDEVIKHHSVKGMETTMGEVSELYMRSVLQAFVRPEEQAYIIWMMKNAVMSEKKQETAKEILERHLFDYLRPFFSSDERTKKVTKLSTGISEEAGAYMATLREIADKAWEAGKERGILEEQNDTEGYIEGSIDKSTFMKQLFPESKTDSSES